VSQRQTETAALVTGHSRGLGAAIAESLLARSIRVVGISRGGNDALAGRYAEALRQVELDLADTDLLTQWLANEELHRLVDGSERVLLVNNAGVLQPVGPLDAQTSPSVMRAVTVNVAAPLALSAAFVGATERASERRILHISSGAGRSAYAGWSVYCATKAALDHHARAVALDRTPRLRICSLAPGVIDTDMQGEVRASTATLFPDRERFVAMKREGRLKDPNRTAAEIVDFLLGDGFGIEPVADLRAH
jgi:benzil reductase ((S)-benzoin forming)